MTATVIPAQLADDSEARFVRIAAYLDDNDKVKKVPLDPDWKTTGGLPADHPDLARHMRDAGKYIWLGKDENKVKAILGYVGLVLGTRYADADKDVKTELVAENGEGGYVTFRGSDEWAKLCAGAGIPVPATFTIKTVSGGSRSLFLQDPGNPVTYRVLGDHRELEVRAAENGEARYAVVAGPGYEADDRPVLPFPPELRDHIASVPPAAPRAGCGDYAQAGEDNAVFAAFKMLGDAGVFGEDEARRVLLAMNAALNHPMDEARLLSTSLRPGIFGTGTPLTAEEMSWAANVEADEDKKYILGKLKRRFLDDEADRQYAAIANPPQKLVTMASLCTAEQPAWIIDGIMPPGVTGLAGPPSAGKSLLARDLGNAVANGKAWKGHSVPEALGVTYVWGEGLFDLGIRFAGIRKDQMLSYPKPVNLLDRNAVSALITEHKELERRTGLIIFDMIYQMGIEDDNNSKDGIPLMAASKTIARELNCAVLLLGHPGYATGRRFRGTSSFRGEFEAEFHMADDLLSCEKQKYAPWRHLRWPYQLDGLTIDYLDEKSALGRQMMLHARAVEEEALHPDEAINSIAERLKEELGTADSTTRRYVTSARRARTESPPS
jgi:hypothetical protein